MEAKHILLELCKDRYNEKQGDYYAGKTCDVDLCMMGRVGNHGQQKSVVTDRVRSTDAINFNGKLMLPLLQGEKYLLCALCSSYVDVLPSISS